MCRLTAILSSKVPVLIESIVTKPRLSIIYQSFNCHERLPRDKPRWAFEKSSLNGDGFGVGWYVPKDQSNLYNDPQSPCVFTSLKPAWSDQNLRQLAKKTLSPLIFAHVRAAGPGSGFPTEANCHPFRFGKYMFMHNGQIGAWKSTRRALLARLKTSEAFDFAMDNNPIDSVILFALFIDNLNGGVGAPDDMRSSMESVIATVCEVCDELKIEDVSYLNTVVSDGSSIVATRFALGCFSDRQKGRKTQSLSLYFATGTQWTCENSPDFKMTHTDKRDDTCIITSEPLTEVREEWVPVPHNTLVLVTSKCDVLMQPLRHVGDGKSRRQRQRSSISQSLESLRPLTHNHQLTPASPAKRRVSAITCRRILKKSAAAVLCLATDHNDNYLFAGDSSGRVVIWDLKMERCVASLLGHRGSVLSLSAYRSPDGKQWLFSSSSDATVVVWTLDTLLHTHPNMQTSDKLLRQTPSHNVVENVRSSLACRLYFEPLQGDVLSTAIRQVDAKVGSSDLIQRRDFLFLGFQSSAIGLVSLDSLIARLTRCHHFAGKETPSPVSYTEKRQALRLLEEKRESIFVSSNEEQSPVELSGGVECTSETCGLTEFISLDDFGCKQIHLGINPALGFDPCLLAEAQAEKLGVESKAVEFTRGIPPLRLPADQKAIHLTLNSCCKLLNLSQAKRDTETRKGSDTETRRDGDTETRKGSDTETHRDGDTTRGSDPHDISVDEQETLPTTSRETSMKKVDETRLLDRERVSLFDPDDRLVKCCRRGMTMEEAEFEECDLLSPGRKCGMDPEDDDEFVSTESMSAHGLLGLEWILLRGEDDKNDHCGFVESLCVTEEYMASGGGDGLVLIWKGVKKYATLTGHTGGVLCLCAADETLYSGGRDKTIRVWDIRTLSCRQILRGHQGDVMSIAISGKFIISASACSEVFAWSRRWSDVCLTLELECIRRSIGGSISNPVVIACLSCNGKGDLMGAGGDGIIRIWGMGEISGCSDGEGVVCASPLPALTRSLMDTDTSLAVSAEKILATLIPLRSISGRSQFVEELWATATQVSRLFESIGADTSLHPTGPSAGPIVMGRIGNDPKAVTVVLYSHYDVVCSGDRNEFSPTNEKSSNWKTDPWQLTSVNGFFRGRGVSDNKGPLVAQVLAVRDFLAQQRHKTELLSSPVSSPGVNIIFLSEGEEENGSLGFREFLAQQKDVLKEADFALFTNSYWVEDDVPCIVHGMRGVIDMQIIISSGREPLGFHSGIHGGALVEPLTDLIAIASKLLDGSGRSTVPGFYDAVDDFEFDEALKSTNAFCLEKYKTDMKSSAFRSDTPKILLHKRWFEPVMSITEINTSTQNYCDLRGRNFRIIPSVAVCHISIRSVPSQDPSDIIECVSEFVREEFAKRKSPNTLEIRTLKCHKWWQGGTDSEIYRAVKKAVSETWGVEPMCVREGGTMPVITELQESLGVATVHLPLGQASDKAHLPNEQLRIENLVKGAEIIKKTLLSLATR